MGFETILLAVDGGIARLTLNRPDQANAIDAVMARELRDAATMLRFDPAVRVVLLDAIGKLFCGGGDLQAFRAAGTGAGALLAGVASDLHVALSTFAAMDAPVVAAVQGSAGGAGMSLVAGADIVVAGERAKFTMGYTAVALAPDGGSTFYLSRVVGLRRAMDLVLTNRTIDARTAEAWGLVTRVVPDEQVDEESWGGGPPPPPPAGGPPPPAPGTSSVSLYLFNRLAALEKQGPGRPPYPVSHSIVSQPVPAAYTCAAGFLTTYRTNPLWGVYLS